MGSMGLCLIGKSVQWESLAGDERMKENRVVYSFPSSLPMALPFSTNDPKESGSFLLNYSSLWVLVATPTPCLFKPVGVNVSLQLLALRCFSSSCPPLGRVPALIFLGSLQLHESFVHPQTQTNMAYEGSVVIVFSFWWYICLSCLSDGVPVFFSHCLIPLISWAVHINSFNNADLPLCQSQHPHKVLAFCSSLQKGSQSSFSFGIVVF